MDEFGRIERRLSLHDLRVLMVVVQAGSMGKAAKLLATSQPAVSRSIGELEQALGVRLLDRSAQGIEPTSFGRALLKRSAAVFDELLHGIKDIRFLADPTTGELTIGASIAIAEGFVASVVTRLSRSYPRLTFQVHATDTAAAYRALLDRRVDLALVHIIEPPAEDMMHIEPLLDDPHVVVAGAHNALARRRRISLAQLAGGTLGITVAGSTVWRSRARGISRARDARSSDCRRLDAAAPNYPAHNRSIPIHGSSRRHAVPSEKPAAQDPADRSAGDGKATSHRHAEEQDAQPARPPIRGLRPGRCQAAAQDVMLRVCVRLRGRP